MIEPDLSLNLAVADYINEKQGSSAREAAITIVKLINSKDTHTAIFAIELLDVLVKNCGFPFHLQISRKDFLNELVKRFPERPPIRYSRPQRMILGAIEEWNQTICKTSRYKEDLGFIRDMHRLLSYKGYVFPEVKPEDASVLNPSDNLKSIEEIQKEESLAQAAKLQELVRRGRPSDLKEANKLMKIMAGFKDDNLVESKARVAEDLDRLKRKAEIFSEMLQAGESAGSIDTSDETLVELYSALKVSQPKIQKIISEESDDEAAVQELLKLNDLVNSLIQKFNLLKSGNVAEASNVKINKGSNSLNLIDFDDDSEPAAASPITNSSSNGLEDLLGDLNGLSMSSGTTDFGLGGSISLSSPSPQLNQAQTSSPAATPAPASTSGPNYDVFSQLSGLSNPAVPSKPVNNTNSSAFDIFSQPSQLSSQISSPPPPPQPVQPAVAESAAAPRTVVSESSHLKFEISISRESPNTVAVKAFFSNLGISPISNLTVLIAVPKSLSIQLNPQSGSFLNAFAKDGVTQLFKISNAAPGAPLKIKWKTNYDVNGTPVEETNTFVLPQV